MRFLMRCKAFMIYGHNGNSELYEIKTIILLS